MRSWIRRNFKPDIICSGVDDIDYESLKRSGISLLLLDIDNTLAVHGSHSADAYAQAAIANIREADLEVFILSNAKRHRARSYAGSLGVEVEGMAYKPSPKVLLRVCAAKNYKPAQACMIGDQLFTDVWAAKRAGVMSILVKPRSDREDFHIRFKRLIERITLGLTENK